MSPHADLALTSEDMFTDWLEKGSQIVISQPGTTCDSSVLLRLRLSLSPPPSSPSPPAFHATAHSGHGPLRTPTRSNGGGQPAEVARRPASKAPCLRDSPARGGSFGDHRAALSHGHS